MAGSTLYDAAGEAIAKGGGIFNRPEDMELGPDGRIYVAITAEHRVIVLDDSGSVPVISDYVHADMAGGDFAYPDNLAFNPQGHLYITEDLSFWRMLFRYRTNNVWVALPDSDGDGHADGAYRFAAWAPSATEPSGLQFSADGKRLYVNSLGHGAAKGAVMVITGFR